MQDMSDEQRGLREKRTQLINESFTHVKTAKLFGWESSFVNSIDKIYKSELRMENDKLW